MSEQLYKQLLSAAKDYQKRSYSPYSHFSVGAAVACADGSVFGGANVENSSYGLCICAERVALVRAIMEGHQSFVAVACVGGNDYCSPCGACRQFLSEFGDMMIVGEDAGGNMIVDSISTLLPKSFRL